MVKVSVFLFLVFLFSGCAIHPCMDVAAGYPVSPGEGYSGSKSTGIAAIESAILFTSGFDRNRSRFWNAWGMRMGHNWLKNELYGNEIAMDTWRIHFDYLLGGNVTDWLIPVAFFTFGIDMRKFDNTGESYEVTIFPGLGAQLRFYPIRSDHIGLYVAPSFEYYYSAWGANEPSQIGSNHTMPIMLRVGFEVTGWL